MSIEEEIFANYAISEEKLCEYGFAPEGGKLAFERALSKDNLKIVVEHAGALRGRIVDLAMDDEYTNFRREDATGYSAAIREQFTSLLLNIRQKCCRNLYFRSEQARRIGDFIQDTYGSAPEFLWPNIPSYAAFRREGDKKWYAVMGSVPLHKLDPNSASREEVEVLNVKVDSAGLGDVPARKGYYPAFHMNKRCWVSIILNGDLGDGEIQRRIVDSYENVKGGR